MVGLNAGKDVDSFCGKCKMTLAHVIIAMKEIKIAKVQCKTCHSIHAYRGDPSLKATKSSTGRTSKPRATTKPKLTANQFEIVMHNRDIARARRYRISETFEDTDVIDHKKFGLGAVIRCMEDSKIEVLFRDGPKVLVHARE